jgi:hypothetical protein
MRSATLTQKRCSWASVDGPVLLQYHDRKWGVPVHTDRKHFEVLVLSGAHSSPGRGPGSVAGDPLLGKDAPCFVEHVQGYLACLHLARLNVRAQ